MQQFIVGHFIVVYRVKLLLISCRSSRRMTGQCQPYIYKHLNVTHQKSMCTTLLLKECSPCFGGSPLILYFSLLNAMPIHG